MDIKENENLEKLAQEWYTDFHVDNVFPDNDVKGNLLESFLDNKIEYEAFNYLKNIGVFNKQSPPKILDIGSGMGKFIAVCKKNNFDCIGLEPSQKGINLAQAYLESQGHDSAQIICSPAENIPFPDNHFDAIISMTVLEHVKDVKKCLQESFRVLKPNGHFYLLVPNFLSFWEGHYRFYFPPYLLSIKPLFRFYTKLRGRNPNFLDSINFNINPWSLTKMLKKFNPSSIENISAERLNKKFSHPETIVDQRMSQLITKVTKYKIIKSLLNQGIKLISKLNSYTPIVMIIRK